MRYALKLLVWSHHTSRDGENGQAVPKTGQERPHRRACLTVGATVSSCPDRFSLVFREAVRTSLRRPLAGVAVTTLRFRRQIRVCIGCPNARADMRLLPTRPISLDCCRYGAWHPCVSEAATPRQDRSQTVSDRPAVRSGFTCSPVARPVVNKHSCRKTRCRSRLVAQRWACIRQDQNTPHTRRRLPPKPRRRHPDASIQKTLKRSVGKRSGSSRKAAPPPALSRHTRGPGTRPPRLPSLLPPLPPPCPTLPRPPP